MSTEFPVPLIVARLVKYRPYSYHLTARDNLASLAESRQLEPAARLLRDHGRDDLLGRRRSEAEGLTSGVRTIWVRDQRPLHAGNIEFAAGWTLAELVAYLNEHVFFWPGTAHGPNRAGINHHRRYEHEHAALLRVSTAALVRAAGDQLRVSRYNSGAPRCFGGRRSPRGPDTLERPDRFEDTVSSIEEVAVRGSLALGPFVETAASYAGPWRPWPP